MFVARVKLIAPSSFRSLYRYLLGDGRCAPLATHNMRFSDAARTFAGTPRGNALHPYTGAAFMLGFTPQSTFSIDEALSLGKEVLDELPRPVRGIGICHAIPYEIVNTHIHWAITRPRDADGSVFRLKTLSAELKRAAGRVRDRHGIAPPTITDNRSYRSAMRGDDFTFYEWVTTTDVLDDLDTAPTADDFFSTLNYFGIEYRPVAADNGEEGFALVDATSDAFAGVRATKLGFGWVALTERFGSFDMPEYDPSLTQTSYAVERREKYPEPLHELHAQYRAEWFAETLPTLRQERARVRAGCQAAIDHAHGLARDLAPEWPAAARRPLVRELRDLFRTERTAQLRDLDLSHPPKPPHRVGDWLRRLASPLPVPPAAVYEGVRWNLPTSASVEYGVDTSVWHDGRRIGHFEGEDTFVLHGTDLRSQTLALLPREATRVYAHPSLDTDRLHLAPDVDIATMDLPEVPNDVRALLEQYPLPESQRALTDRLLPQTTTAITAEPSRPERRGQPGWRLRRPRR